MPSRLETCVFTVGSETHERLGDLGVREPDREHAQHLLLAVGQLVEAVAASRDTARRQPAADLVEQLARDGGGEHGVAGGDRAHRVDDLAGSARP